MELLKVVKEDLEYLAEEWTQDIDDASLRRASPILRKLLIEGDLYTVARQFNEEISILTPEITKFDNELNDPSIVLMCAEKTGGFNLVNYRHSSGVYHEQETEDLHRRI